MKPFIFGLLLGAVVSYIIILAILKTIKKI
jgi:hypothetical protein